ncbi:uncharacterized protein LOC131843554 [Achroia grisella]|uniref:uncharacterized protein LOC131843554 n=1 Tax=Achroia grisella TaxID=688607 RepID=UPI0027D2347F|nr:uncharacterized protein LOC131843554 [Achroia grisella]
MFYDSKLMNSSCIKNIWRAANDQSTNLEDEKLPDICTWLDGWITSDHNNAGSRLSLRTAAVLIDGAAKVYERKLKRLFEDIDKLESDMIKRKRLHSVRSDEYSIQSGDDQDTTMSSDEKSEQSETSIDKSNVSDISQKQGVNREDVNIITPGRSIPDSNSVGSERQLSTSIELLETSDTENTSVTKEDSTSHEEKRCTEEDTLMGDFDENLPFGYVMIYNSIRDKIPRKIIFSSFNRDLQKLI